MSLLAIDLVIAFFVAVLLTTRFAAGPWWRGPWLSVPAFFVVLFVASWAGGVWLTPLGPAVWGFYWLPFVVIAIVVALMLVISRRPAGPREERGELSPRRGGPVWLAALYSALVILSVVAILAKYAI